MSATSFVHSTIPPGGAPPRPYPYTLRTQCEGGSAIIANLATGMVVQLGSDDINGLARHSTMYEVLASAGFFAADQDQLTKRIVDRHRNASTRPAVFNLTILPTLACNLACRYCFELEHKPLRMSDETAKRIAAFVQRQAKRHMRIDVAWFGGEPLLEMSRIIQLHSEIRKIAHGAGCELSSSITTNGHRLDAKAAHSLRQLEIRNLQVTIDGNQATHDSNRPTRRGTGSYARILQNAIGYLNIDRSGHLVIRVNATPTSMASILETLPLFAPELRPRITVHIHHIMKKDGQLLPTEEFTRSLRSVYQAVRGLGMNAAVDHYLEPGPAVYCYAERASSAVIDPLGRVYKCAYTDFSGSEAVGVLEPGGEVKPSGTFGSTWNELVRTEPAKCMACEYLPLCGFGCPRLRKTRAQDHACRNRFHCLEDTLRHLSLSSL